MNKDNIGMIDEITNEFLKLSGIEDLQVNVHRTPLTWNVKERRICYFDDLKIWGVSGIEDVTESDMDCLLGSMVPGPST